MVGKLLVKLTLNKVILQDFIMNAQYYENIVTIENFFNTVFQIVFIPHIQRVIKILATQLTI